MKKIISLLILFCSIQGYPAILRNVPVDLQQPDGRIIRCYATGDEFYHRVHDAKGFTIIRNSKTGYFVYAQLEGEKLVPSDFRVGFDDPEISGLTPGLEIPARQMEGLRTERLKSTAIFNDNPTKGTFNNIIISIRFFSQGATSLSVSDYEDRFNAPNGYSLNSYFKEISQSQLNIASCMIPAPNGQTIIEYEDLNFRNYYLPYNEVNNPVGYSDSNRFERDVALLKSAINFAAVEIERSPLDFDLNDDGFIDNITFVIQGNPDGWGNILWPTASTLASENIVVGNLKVGTFNKQCSTWLTADVLSHEFFHTLGAPDLYRYINNSVDPVSYWDIMGSTKFQHPTTYVKWKYGKWFDDIPEIDGSGNFILPPVSRSPFACFKIPSPVTTDEFFMVEYRKKEGIFESTIPAAFADGLIIYRINTKVHDGNINGPPDEVYIYRKYGTDYFTGMTSSSSFSEETGMTEFGDNTNPSCFLSNGSLGHIRISGIGYAGETISFSVNQDNRPPVAKAGPDQIVGEASQVTLDGSASSDIDNDPLSFFWTAPEEIILNSLNDPKPTFFSPEVNSDTTFVFSLVVSDGKVNSAPDQVLVTVRNDFHAPVAKAGPDQVVSETTLVTLDGSASLDSDGDALTYRWTAPAGIVLSSTTSAKPTFTAPGVANDSTFIFILVVNDGTLDSSPDTVTITVKKLTSVNLPPVANAGSDQTVNEGDNVILDGRASSDPEANSLSFRWIAPPGITLSSSTSATPGFTAPQVSANTFFVFHLIVNDGSFDSPMDSVVITVKQVNKPPVANAGADQEVNEGVVVNLNGYGSSDPDDDPIQYFWTSPSGVTLNSVNLPNPFFTAPEVQADTTLTFLLVVNDGTANSATDTVTIKVRQLNKRPIANAGFDQSVKELSLVTVIGTGSYDPDGDNIKFLWVAPPQLVLNSVTGPAPSFVAPEVTSDTTFIIKLVVNDGKIDSDTAFVAITVKNANKTPVANAGANQTVVEGSKVTLDGSASFDPDGDLISYYWNPPIGIQLSSVFVASPTFTAPEVDKDSSFNFTLFVDDGDAVSAPSIVIITVLNDIKPVVADVSQENFRVYPNPSNGIVNIEWTGLESKKMEISVLDVTGRIIFQKNFDGEGVCSLDLSEQVSGVYLLRVTQDGRQHFGKIVLKKD